MPKYLSGRSKRTPNERLPLDRYNYISLGDAEPNPSDPKTLGISEGAIGPVVIGDAIPSGVKYQLIYLHKGSATAVLGMFPAEYLGTMGSGMGIGGLLPSMLNIAII